MCMQYQRKAQISQDLAEIESLMSPINNHEAYRQRVGSLRGFYLPYLAVTLKDIMSTDNAYEVSFLVNKISQLIDLDQSFYTHSIYRCVICDFCLICMSKLFSGS